VLLPPRCCYKPLDLANHHLPSFPTNYHQGFTLALLQSAKAFLEKTTAPPPSKPQASSTACDPSSLLASTSNSGRSSNGTASSSINGSSSNNNYSSSSSSSSRAAPAGTATISTTTIIATNDDSRNDTNRNNGAPLAADGRLDDLKIHPSPKARKPRNSNGSGTMKPLDDGSSGGNGGGIPLHAFVDQEEAVGRGGRAASSGGGGGAGAGIGSGAGRGGGTRGSSSDTTVATGVDGEECVVREGALAKRGRVTGTWKERTFRLTAKSLSCVVRRVR
jgi:hypothetical protein